MLCAEDEQSRTCWMTAFRLLKVGPGQVPRSIKGARTRKHQAPPPPSLFLAPQYGIVLYQSYNVPQQRKSSLSPFSGPVVRICSLTPPLPPSLQK